MHSRLVRIRNGLTYSSRYGKILASLRALALAFSRPLVFEAVITTSHGTERRKAMALAVSNNVLGEGPIPYAEAVDRGVLGVYVVKPMPPLELVRLASSLVFGSWKAHPLVSEKEVSQVALSFPRRKASAQAVIDGELAPLERNIDLRIHAGGLKVVLPGTPRLEPSADPAIEVA
jgi:diacylglycerol kinase family enzyme